MAFVDMRMPPGWDGLETIRRIWGVDPRVEMVICTAHSDRSWQEIRDTVGDTDQLLIIKKPFDVVEVKQAARALVQKWTLHRSLQERLQDLEERVQERTAELERLNDDLRREMEDRKRMEVELRHAQKIEAVGLLAAGIAHEINTPIQFVGDSAAFLGESFRDLFALVDRYRLAYSGLPSGEKKALSAELAEAEAAADLEYLQEEIPKAVARTHEGVGRVAAIVQAMKEFGHPSGAEKHPADLNAALENTLIVARNEYKYVADVELDLGPIPPVPCHIGDLNQVFLNLVVNAAHAVGDVVASSGGRGRIRVRTHDEDEHVVVSVEDSGGGIPPEIRQRVFDPFFTTKEVGRGTGQGLAISHAIVVDKHGGTLSFDTVQGEGTTFRVRLPKGTESPPEEAEPRTVSATVSASP
jgi:signal transduction histidine kinase